jgi:hypothetical protein
MSYNQPHSPVKVEISTLVKRDPFRYESVNEFPTIHIDIGKKISNVSGDSQDLFKESQSKYLPSIAQEETFKNLLDLRGGIIQAENWTHSYLINSRLVKINEETVECDCLVDIEKSVIELRSFPKHLIDYFDFKIGDPILIKVNIKPGSSRIDFIKGAGIVDISKFRTEEKINEMSSWGLDKPIEW